MKLSLRVNGAVRTVDVDPDEPLLWVVRDDLGLTGTKFGCGIGACGACTVHVGGEAVRSCITAVSSVGAKPVTTIEGLNHPLQRAWIAEDVPQCGYCQAGQIMQAADLLRRNPNPTAAEIETAMTGNICRCGTYDRIQRAIRRAAGES